jgi:hypothetical protein
LDDQVPTPTGGQEETAEERIARKVHEEQSGEFEQFDEATGEVVPKEPKEAPEPAPEPAEPEPEPEAAEAPPAAPEPVKAVRKVKVYGQEEEVPEDVLIEHGIRNYQKDRAADIKLQNAARKEREVDEYLARIQQGQPPQGADHQPAPSTDAPPEDIDSRLERVVYNRETVRAGAQFRKDFPEIAEDPHLMNMAYQLEQERLASVAALGEPYGDPFETYRAHGEAIRKWVKKFAGDKPVVSVDKTELKRSITAIPAVNARAPSPPAEKPLTVSQIIELERQTRAGKPIPKR